MKSIYLLILLQLSCISCKTVIQTFSYAQLKAEPWHYLTKFQADIGETSYYVKFRILGHDNTPVHPNLNLNMEIYLDEDWNNKVELIPVCNRSKFARIKKEIFIQQLDSNTAQVQGKLTQRMRPHVWFFAFSDCDRQILSIYPTHADIKLEVTIHLKDEGSEFSMEDKGSLQWVGLLSVMEIILLLFFMRFCLIDFKRNEEYDWPLIILIACLILEALQNLSHFTHLLSYSQNGLGLVSLQLTSEVLQVLSNFALTSLLILISWGWSIRFMKIEQMDVLIPLGSMVGCLQILVMALGKMNDDMHHKYHPYDSWVGWVISAIEMGLFLYFQLGIRNSRCVSGSDKILQFITCLSVYGSLYFLGFPILLVISKYIAQYLRYKFIMVGTNIMRLFAIVFMARLFTSKSSGYCNISYKNQTFMDRSKAQ